MIIFIVWIIIGIASSVMYTKLLNGKSLDVKVLLTTWGLISLVTVLFSMLYRKYLKENKNDTNNNLHNDI